MTVWAVANPKGGVGKTTTTVSLGGLLAAWGFRTLMVDLDPQGSLTGYFGLDPEYLEQGSYRLFEAAVDREAVDPLSLVCQTNTRRLELLPASASLAKIDRQCARHGGLGRALPRATDRLCAHYDYVLVDCPPALGILAIDAMVACDRLVVPVPTEFLAIRALGRLQRTQAIVNRVRPRPLDAIVVPTFYDRRTRASRDGLALMRRDYADRLWEGRIPLDTRFRDASRVGLPPAVFDLRARGVVAYSSLLERLVRGHPAGRPKAIGRSSKPPGKFGTDSATVMSGLSR